LAEGAAAAPDLPARQLPLLPSPERARLLGDWNATERPLPDRCFSEVFEAQARLTPDAVAVIDDDGRLSYAELAARAADFAAAWRGAGVGPDVMVALLMPRGAAFLAAMLGTWKAGGAYVPLDPAWPSLRLAQALDGARPAAIVVAAALV